MMHTRIRAHTRAPQWRSCSDPSNSLLHKAIPSREHSVQLPFVPTTPTYLTLFPLHPVSTFHPRRTGSMTTMMTSVCTTRGSDSQVCTGLPKVPSWVPCGALSWYLCCRHVVSAAVAIAVGSPRTHRFVLILCVTSVTSYGLCVC